MAENSPLGPLDGLEIERRRNLASRAAWTLYAEHRAIVTDHLLRAGDASAEKRLCLLGAGNCNDVDVSALVRRYGSIDLVDWDTAALPEGLARQNLLGDGRVHAFGDVDLSGIAASLDHAGREAITGAALAALANAAATAELKLPRSNYDVVASLGLLSQLVDHVARLAPQSPERLLGVIQAIRLRHFQLMLDHLRPGGMLLLVADFVSSDTCPELLTIGPDEFPQAALRWIADGNFFTGLNPHALLEVLRSDASTSPRVAESQLVRPWRWSLSPRRAVAACAIKAITK